MGSSSVALPSKVLRPSEGVAALVMDLRTESKLTPLPKTRSKLSRTRLTGPAAGAMGLSFSGFAEAGLRSEIPREYVGELADVAVLIVASGRPPIGSSGSRLCFIRLGAENCLRSSSSSKFLISGVPCTSVPVLA